jgi:alcohol dehydrogenase
MSGLKDPAKLAVMPAFEAEGRPHLVFGAGCSQRVGELAADLGAKRALLVTDSGIVAAGHAARIAASLRAAEFAVTLFADAHENPTTRDVDACVAVGRETGADLIVGLGGGSAMDTAKGTNFILTNGGRIQDYWGIGKAAKPMLPLIAIPTTAGTGSEMQCAALIADEVTHQKMACLDFKVLPMISILDPELTLSQPERVAVCTGLDAIVHAVETAVTTKRSVESAGFSTEAFKLCLSALPEVLRAPNNLSARGRMQLGAAFAGAAIERSMLGAAHAAANPLTAHFGVVHGNAVGLLLPHVVRFNAAVPSASAQYAELSRSAGLAGAATTDGVAVERMIGALEDLLALVHLPRTCAALSVNPEAIPALAEEAAKQWTAGFNPRPIGESEFIELYEAALGLRS